MKRHELLALNLIRSHLDLIVKVEAPAVGM
jgi:hypothetical protein